MTLGKKNNLTIVIPYFDYLTRWNHVSYTKN